MNDLRRVISLRVVIDFARNVLLDNEDSSEENDVLEKVDNFAEYTVPHMTDRQFQMHFRLTVETFEDLLQKMYAVRAEYINNNNVKHGFPRTILEKEAMIMIWSLSNQECFRSVADRFGVSKSTCWDILYRNLHLLLKVNKKFKIISWPSQARQEEIREHFQVHGFPGIIGCIDGSHIKINKPKEHPGSYINRKNFHSVLLQGVCDHRRLFTDVYAGEAGSIHDYTLYKRSDLYSGIRNRELTFHDNNHIVGDLAYKLETHLLVGFKNNRNITQREKNFNYILSKARVTIEIAFALLKGRFRRLKMLETVRLDFISLLIVSGCILHNICILKGDLLEDIINIQEEFREEILNNPRNLLDVDPEQEDNNARRKRYDIVNSLPVRLRH
ncbi:unnamed protein product [Tenebrio molitor]|jgi:predicted DNA-binding protein YlxM (UPF0122 family)|nr:unnamed protein product [Tenebrio molitor]